MQLIKFTGAHHPEENMTVGRHYTPLAFSKNYDSYRVKDDAGFTDWHYMKNFELVPVGMKEEKEMSIVNDRGEKGQIVKPATSGRPLVTFEEIFGRPRTPEELKEIAEEVIENINKGGRK